MLEDILKNIGLTQEEAQIYESLLNHGPQSASDLSKSTPIKRTYVYHICENLLKKGVIGENKEQRAVRFMAQPPEALSIQAKNQLLQAQQAQRSLEDILPSLQDKFHKTSDKPEVTHLAGPNGFKTIFKDILETKSLTDIILSPHGFQSEVSHWIGIHFHPARIQSQIPLRIIEVIGEKTHESLFSNSLDYLEKKQISNTATFAQHIFLYDQKAVFLQMVDHTESNMMIRNDFIANSLKAWFELTWSTLS